MLVSNGPCTTSPQHRFTSLSTVRKLKLYFYSNPHRVGLGRFLLDIVHSHPSFVLHPDQHYNGPSIVATFVDPGSNRTELISPKIDSMEHDWI